MRYKSLAAKLMVQTFCYLEAEYSSQVQVSLMLLGALASFTSS